MSRGAHQFDDTSFYGRTKQFLEACPAPWQSGKRLVALSLFLYASDDGAGIYASVETQMKFSGLTRSVHTKYLAELETDGVLLDCGTYTHRNGARTALRSLDLGRMLELREIAKAKGSRRTKSVNRPTRRTSLDGVSNVLPVDGESPTDRTSERPTCETQAKSINQELEPRDLHAPSSPEVEASQFDFGPQIDAALASASASVEPEPTARPARDLVTVPIGRRSKAPKRVRPEEFEEFWEINPRKVGSGKAETSFAKARQIASFEEIMFGWRRDVAQFEQKIEAGEGKYVPHASTWLNEKRWRDKPHAHIEASRRVNPNSGNSILAARQKALGIHENTLHGAPIGGPVEIIPEIKRIK